MGLLQPILGKILSDRFNIIIQCLLVKVRVENMFLSLILYVIKVSPNSWERQLNLSLIKIIFVKASLALQSPSSF